jgi:hypothetical protein
VNQLHGQVSAVARTDVEQTGRQLAPFGHLSKHPVDS